jgi:tol-pal system protein YbgF
MSKRIGQGLAAVMLLAVATSPAWADRRTDERLQALEDRMERVDRLMENNALLDLVTRMDAMQQELRELRGQNEELAHELETLKSRQRELYLDLDRRIQDVETAGTNGASVSPAPAAAPAAAVPAPAGAATAPSGSTPTPGGAPAAAGMAPSSERDAYKQAFDLLREGQYAQAITAFQGFLQRHPQSGYAANAQYWLGEANYVSKQYPTAATEFRKVLDNYPDSNKVPDATLKLGYTYYELGEWAKARDSLTQVKTQYAGSSVARLAEQRLARMQREGH